MKKLLMAAAAAAMIGMAAAPVANAATIYDDIDQTTLDTTGTETFGAIIDALGPFTHAFTFSLGALSSASSAVVTIRNGALADIDLTSVDLDGIAFTPACGVPGCEPGEVWFLDAATIGTGLHTITVKGKVITTSTTDPKKAASYAGTLNIAPVPEPATWAFMIMGFGGAGAMIRRRRSLALA